VTIPIRPKNELSVQGRRRVAGARRKLARQKQGDAGVDLLVEALLAAVGSLLPNTRVQWAATIAVALLFALVVALFWGHN
jgi:hypothetical protein